MDTFTAVVSEGPHRIFRKLNRSWVFAFLWVIVSEHRRGSVWRAGRMLPRCATFGRDELIDAVRRKRVQWEVDVVFYQPSPVADSLRWRGTRRQRAVSSVLARSRCPARRSSSCAAGHAPTRCTTPAISTR